MANQIQRKRIVFLTGTRADFGKIKSLLAVLENSGEFEIHIFVTGMHMLERYGLTWREVDASEIGTLYKFINQNHGDSLDGVFAKTVTGFSDYVKEIKPDLIIVHGDRVEALAGATVGALSGILVAHIEGGEVSGTVDELIRHAVTKMSHFHFVSGKKAYNRVKQLGELPSSIFIIGSPEVDVMESGHLPNIDEVRSHYDFDFQNYGILMFHPVTTEIDRLVDDAQTLVSSVIESGLNFVVIMPNNDPGTFIIQEEFARLAGLRQFRVLPSMRFEYFLSLLKNADFMIGNSSSGVREAPHFGVPSINLGSRQNNRSSSPMIMNIDIKLNEIAAAINESQKMIRVKDAIFGDGKASEKFLKHLKNPSFWVTNIQKTFVDLK